MGGTNLFKVTIMTFVLIVFSAVFDKIILLKLIKLSNFVTAEVVTQEPENYKQQRNSDLVSDEIKKIQSLINIHFKALTQEDLAACMNTIAKDSPHYESNKKIVKLIFDTYDLKYEVKDFQVVNLSNQEAQIKLTQITTKVRGPAFRNNRLEAIHTFKKYNNEWKVYDTKVLRIEYLN